MAFIILRRAARVAVDATFAPPGGKEIIEEVMGVCRTPTTRQRALCSTPFVRTMIIQQRTISIWTYASQDEKINRGTVYRNLNLLEEAGIISSVKTPGGNRFDWRPDGHAHILCRKCGRVQDVPLAYDLGLDEACGAQTGLPASITAPCSPAYTDCLGDSPTR